MFFALLPPIMTSLLGPVEKLLCLSTGSCWSYVGRQGGSQTVSLSRQGCLYHGTVQHELLHALGFNHEQTRSDRDNHIQVVWDNIIQGQARFKWFEITLQPLHEELAPPSGPQ